MANVTFKLEGKNKFSALLRVLASTTDKEVKAAIKKAGKRIRTEAVKEISRGARAGRVYKRGKKVHVASAEGEFPKTDTGNLVRNITVRPEGKMAITVGSRAQAPEGYFLETNEPSQGGRPWLSPIIKRNEKKIFKDIKLAVRGSFRIVFK